MSLTQHPGRALAVRKSFASVELEHCRLIVAATSSSSGGDRLPTSGARVRHRSIYTDSAGATSALVQGELVSNKGVGGCRRAVGGCRELQLSYRASLFPTKALVVAEERRIGGKP